MVKVEILINPILVMERFNEAPDWVELVITLRRCKVKYELMMGDNTLSWVEIYRDERFHKSVCDKVEECKVFLEVINTFIAGNAGEVNDENCKE